MSMRSFLTIRMPHENSIISSHEIIPDGCERAAPRPRTARELYRRGRRPIGKPVGKKIYLHAEPHHGMRNQAWPLDTEELHVLRDEFHQDKDAAIESDLYFRAFRAGQITLANLYPTWEKI